MSSSGNHLDSVFNQARTSRFKTNVPPVRLAYHDSFGGSDLVWVSRESQLVGKFFCQLNLYRPIVVVAVDRKL
jgi:hypothetical protein